MSGFEIVGLVFGVLPVCIELISNEHGPIKMARNAFSLAKHGEALGEFYGEFHYQLTILDMSMKRLAEALALPEELQQALDLSMMKPGNDPYTWAHDPRFNTALQSLFSGTVDWKVVEGILRKVLGLFATVLEDESVRLSKAHLNQIKMFETIKELQHLNKLGKHKDSIRKRLRFFIREKDRISCVDSLHRWNKRLSVLIDKVCDSIDRRRKSSSMTSFLESSTGAGLPGYASIYPDSESSSQSKATAIVSSIPTIRRLRDLSKKLFTEFSHFGTCDCPAQHQAELCLSNCRSNTDTTLIQCSETKTDASICGLSFDFLLRLSSTRNDQEGHWCEGTVQFQPGSTASGESSEEHIGQLDSLCGSFGGITTGSRKYMGLKVIIEDIGTAKYKICSQAQPTNRLRNFSMPDPEAISFDECLRRFKTPTLLERRRLALTLAYSLFHLHGSPWLTGQWDKENIHFFPRPGTALSMVQSLDFEHPYLNTLLGNLPTEGKDQSVQKLFHRSPGVLKLGLLLLEIHMWKRIEELREPTDLDDTGQPLPNTDIGVAYRVVSENFSVEEDSYSKLITACLCLPWITGTLPESRDGKYQQDEIIWDGVYNSIIMPLKQEISLVEAPK
ncbi:hypothetical protein BJ508DRAFT_302404 [Ascobolus immersus RN42]|uniref:DUF7580 domain-containing protein n=1 Tax=Ascobolus immersus RN42 TaxID=1160509 RepID=A0A3N4IIR1_ASCIM|nr:hypothetical protein BJ508DRAFT_302404 [Ascobolus immersus RN42]